MAIAGFMWECSCGHVEYGEPAPEECPKCFALDSFMQMPEEIIEERQKEMMQEESLTPGPVKAVRKTVKRKTTKKKK